MKKPTSQDLKVLSVLREYPQGAMLWQVKKFAEIELKEYALYYLKKAIRKGWAEKKGHLYFLKGDINLVQPTTPYHPKPKPVTPTQRPHAIQADAQLYRTSLDRAERTLQLLELPYKKLLGGNVIVLLWRNIELRITSRGKLIIHPELPEYPLNVPLEPIKAKAAIGAGVIAEAFIIATGLRCIRDRLGRLVIQIHYWENGFPKNEIATENLKNKPREVYAYDKETGQAVIWGDGSPDPFKELETNREVADKEIKALMQGIADGEVKPFEDEIRTRQEIAGMTQIQLEQAHLMDRLTQDLAKYAHNEIVHLDLLNKIRAENQKIKDMLSQRRLL